MDDEHIQAPPPTMGSPASSSAPVGAHDGSTKSAADVRPAPGDKAFEQKDSLREIVETIVFVIVLVLLLKSFVAEAFVIPTGSMATTLYGYQKNLECPECGFHFPVNCSSEVEHRPDDIHYQVVNSATCPNCRYPLEFGEEVKYATGDRVLVGKLIYDLVASPKRFDVLVFKFPQQPLRDKVPLNYIKRLVGLPGETVGIYFGDLYKSDAFVFEDKVPDWSQLPTGDQHEIFMERYMHVDDPALVQAFRDQVIDQRDVSHRFQILRKSPEVMLAVRRIVYDNDFPARDRPGLLRWQPKPKTSWKLDNDQLPTRFEHANTGEDTDWLHYRHILRDSPKPQLITDFLAYNSRDSGGLNWVGDLMLECDVSVDRPGGQLILELAKGVDRFQARFDLADGTCQLVRVNDKEDTILKTAETSLKSSGTYRLRFANFDERLTLWVDRDLPFGEGVVYQPPKQRGPTINDLQPASIGVREANVIVEHIKLWRDTYYTTTLSPSDFGRPVDWSNPSEWRELGELQPKLFYVQPDHYFCLGDNSPASSDSRKWGLVPRRLILGRALLVYWPLYRAGPIR
ncbi:MAG: hypothetical protein KatS3mg105_3953 [Gemmatales bacterium]|nr:MAG: hypothetical protein KatS3mg105_3953 [Gemmatales bacterium]